MAAPTTITSPTLSVPRWTSTVASGPRPLSSLASTTVASAARSGLAFSSRISAWRLIASSKPSRLVFLSAETSTSWTSPPIASTMISCCSSSSRTFCGLAPGLSILLIATIIGTPAALVWLIASIVCGFRPSSAATTSTTMSVTLAPRARISVKASWPGVSRKVTFDSVLQRDLIGADVLGDAAGLAGDDIGAADRVEQRRLAVIDMAHDRHHRRARLQRFVGIDVDRGVDVDVGFRHRLDAVAELLDQQLGGVLVDGLGDGDRRAHLEQRLDQVGAALAHALGELLDGDRLGHVHVADLLGGRTGLLMGALFLLAGAAKRGEAAGAAVVFAGQGAGDGQLAGMAAIVAAAAGTGRLGALGRMAGGGGWRGSCAPRPAS